MSSSYPVPEVTMTDVEQAIATLATSRPRPWGLISLLKRAPNSLRWRLIMMFRLLKREWMGMVHRVQGRRIVHFLHIGKTGGTASKSSIRGYENSGDYEIVLRDHYVDLADIPRGEKVIFFVRDPVSRFVSGFYGRWRKDQPRHNIPWSPGEQAAFTRFRTPNELAVALSSDDKELQAAAVSAFQSIEHVGQPQWLWFRSESYFLSRKSDILFIGFQETLSADFSLLKRILNLPRAVSLPDDGVIAHRNPADLDKRLDPEAIRNLKAWYWRDYRFLELCREVATQVRSDFEQHSPQSLKRGQALST
jgi:hypothetical protein